MTRTTRLTVVAIAAAALAPVAHAADAPDPGLINDPGIVLTAPPAPFPLPDPAYVIDIPGAGVVPSQGEREPATEPAKPAKAPSSAKQQGFWGMHTTPTATLITDNSPSQNRLSRRALREVAAEKKRTQQPVHFTTENSPSQNRVAPRKVGATRTLAKTLRTFAG